MKKQLIELRVNGRTYEIAAEPNALLLDVLRQQLQLTGSKRGCDDSSCGACTVLVDGVPTLSCTVLAMSFAADEQPGPEIATAFDRLAISPRGIAARVRGLHSQNRSVETAGAGSNATVLSVSRRAKLSSRDGTARPSSSSSLHEPFRAIARPPVVRGSYESSAKREASTDCAPR